MKLIFLLILFLPGCDLFDDDSPLPATGSDTSASTSVTDSNNPGSDTSASTSVTDSNNPNSDTSASASTSAPDSILLKKQKVEKLITKIKQIEAKRKVALANYKNYRFKTSAEDIKKCDTYFRSYLDYISQYLTAGKEMLSLLEKLDYSRSFGQYTSEVSQIYQNIKTTLPEILSVYNDLKKDLKENKHCGRTKQRLQSF